MWVDRLLNKLFNRGASVTNLSPDGFFHYVNNVVGTSIVVTPETAQTLNAVYACVNLITETSTLVSPKIYRHDLIGKVQVNNHDQTPLLTRSANENTSSIEFEKNWIAAYLLHGNGYGEIERYARTARPNKYINIKNEYVQKVIIDNGVKKYIVKEPGKEARVIKSENMLHLCDLSMGDLVGMSRISQNKGTLKEAGIIREYSNDMFENGSNINGYIYNDKAAAGPEALELIRKGFNAKKGTSILPHGFRYEQLRYNLALADAQTIEAKKLSTEDIARIFRTPLSLIMRGESADNKGENEWNIFITTTIAPLALLRQAELNRKIFRKTETDHYVKYELKGLYRTAMKDRYEAHRIAINAGFMNPDEVREVEDMNPTSDGSGREYMKPLNSIPASMWNKYYESMMESGKQDKANSNGNN